MVPLSSRDNPWMGEIQEGFLRSLPGAEGTGLSLTISPVLPIETRGCSKPSEKLWNQVFTLLYCQILFFEGYRGTKQDGRVAPEVHSHPCAEGAPLPCAHTDPSQSRSKGLLLPLNLPQKIQQLWGSLPPSPAPPASSSSPWLTFN